MLAASRQARVAASTGRGPAHLGPAPAATARGWVPEVEPPEADTTWLEDPWASEVAVQGPEPPDPGSGAPAGRHRRGPRVITVPTPLTGARVSVSWRAVVAFAVVVLVAGAVFAVRVARAQDAAAPQAIVGGGLVGRTAPATAVASGASAGSSGGSPAAAPASAGSSAGGSSRRTLVVDVVGQVAHPGVVSVPDGSRVGDVLAAAGGTLPGADVQRLNLARLVGDGEQLVVPKPGETLVPPLTPSGGDDAAPGSTSAAVVDLNTATLASLDSLPGVGPVLAQRILDWRGEHGRFSSIDELGEVSGIGDKLLAQIRARVRV